MSDKGKRDLNQQVVDFLIKDKDQKNDKTQVVSETQSEQLGSTRAYDNNPSEPVSFELEESKAVQAAIPEPPSELKSVRMAEKPKDFSPQTARSATIYNEVAQLAHDAQAVQVAQARINTLEHERDQLRNEVEKLLTATEAMQRRSAELKTQVESTDRRYRQKTEVLEEEKVVLLSRLHAKEQELGDLKKMHEELQMQFGSELRKVRIRERELENRQELMKAETQVVLNSKDEMILELRRQLEQLKFEIENFKLKSADMAATINAFYDRNHRTVKALRVALSVLEGNDADQVPTKKASGE